jgi:hypothetical protein
MHVNSLAQKFLYEFEIHRQVGEFKGSIKLNTCDWREVFDIYPVGFGENYSLHYQELLMMCREFFPQFHWAIEICEEKPENFKGEHWERGIWLNYLFKSECQE